jgi:hypothetical protein
MYIESNYLVQVAEGKGGEMQGQSLQQQTHMARKGMATSAEG